MIDDPAIELDELMEHHPRPRLPHRRAPSAAGTGIREAYRTGRGKVILRAKYEIEELKDGRVADHLHRDPLPAHQGAAAQEAGRAGQRRPDHRRDQHRRLQSDRKQPVRIVVKVKKGEDPNVVVNQLFEYSPLQDTFSVIMLALVDGRPKTLPLKDLLRLFVEHRVNVIRRRTQYPAPPGAAAGAHRRRAC